MSSEIPGGGPYRAAIGSHEVVTSDSMRALRRARSSYCSSDFDLCRRYRSIVSEAGRLIAKARLDELTSDGYTGVDVGFLKVCELVRDLYAAYLSGTAVARGERVLMESRADLVTPEGYVVREGEVWYADVKTAAAFYALGVAKPALSWPDELQDFLG